MTATFTLSAFGDEISNDLGEQLETLKNLNIRGLDLRNALGKNVVDMDEDDARQVLELCDRFGVRVACLGSPVGKSPLADPVQFELDRLINLVKVGNIVGTNLVRIFSFYPPDTASNLHYDQHIAEVSDRLGELTKVADAEGFILVLENEKGIVTDTPDRCLSVLQAVNSPALRFAWDSANFIQVGVAQPVDLGWVGLAPYFGYVHIKDALLDSGQVVPAGEGDGQLVELLTHLKESGYQGTLALEPHLKIAGHSSGFSGSDGMRIAVEALRKLMMQVGCKEI